MRLTNKNSDGTYSTSLSTEELISAIGKLEDKSEVATPKFKVSDPCYIVSDLDRGEYYAIKGTIKKYSIVRETEYATTFFYKEGLDMLIWIDMQNLRFIQQ